MNKTTKNLKRVKSKKMNGGANAQNRSRSLVGLNTSTFTPYGNKFRRNNASGNNLNKQAKDQKERMEQRLLEREERDPEFKKMRNGQRERIRIMKEHQRRMEKNETKNETKK